MTLGERGTRVQCTAHGLYFDPALSNGCALCRRSLHSVDPEPPATRAAVSRALGVCLLAAVGLSIWYLARQEAAVEKQPAAPANAAASVATGAPEPRVQPPSDGLHPLQPQMWEEIQADWEPAALPEAERQRLLQRRVELYVPRAHHVDIEGGKLQGTRPTPDTIVQTAQALGTLLLVYPARLIERIGLRRVVLVDDLVHRGARPGAMAMGPAGTLFTTTAAVKDPYGLHHELFHFADYRLYGFPPRDAGWDRINPSVVQHLGARNMLVSTANAPRADLPGFVSAYAQAAPVEDRAEVFASLMARAAFMAERRSADPIIAAKARYLLDALDKLDPGAAAALGLR